MVQDNDGVLWVGNTQGLLEYDGVSWKTHDLLASSTIVELELSDEGMIYVGGRGDFGYLQTYRRRRRAFYLPAF